MFKSLSDFNGFHDSDTDNDQSSVVITEIPSSDNSSLNNLSRQKSCSNENLTDDENNLKRSSKVRRSLQFPKQSHSPEPEIDWCAGKSLKERAAEIENLLRRGSSTATTISQNSDKSSDSSEKVKNIKTRDSFVSAETLNEVRDRLKKTHVIDNDDGIVTEKEEPQSKVKCFVYGMEAMLAGNRINGTGSLESRNNKNSMNNSRSAEWYKRRKSYGFEQVEEPDKFDKFNRKYNMESSTDSGICRSSETVSTPSWNKFLPAKLENLASPTIVTVGKVETESKAVNSVYVNNTQAIFPKEENRKQMFKRYTDDSMQSETVWNRKSPIPIQRKNDVRESLKSSLRSAKNPWISQLRGTKLVDRNWISDEHDSDTEKIPEAIDDNNSKKNKKVEFCKTEVHFAAEPGKFNIVETDGKPPPNDIFRRRKRHSAPKNTSGLPEIKFGDSVYEKRLLTNSDSISEKIEAELKELSKIVVEALPAKEETPKTPNSPRLYDLAEEPDDTPRSILKPLNRPPASPTTPIWRSTVILRNKHFDDVKKKSDDSKLYSSDGESELQIRFRNLRKVDPEKRWWENNSDEKTETQKDVKRRSLPDDSLLRNNGEHVQKMNVNSEEMPTLSVAERIKQVEELRSNNYSSKINLRSGEMTVVQNGTGSPEKVNEEGSRIISTWLQRKSMSEKDFNARNRPNITCGKDFLSFGK